MSDSLDNLELSSDHDILLVIATEMRHLQTHTATLSEKVGVQNGRMTALEKSYEPQKGVPKRVELLERWQIRMGVVITAIGVGWPLLIYEFRQFLLEKFGFIPPLNEILGPLIGG